MTPEFKKACKAAARQTEQNYHTSARATLARATGTEKGNRIATALELIDQEHVRVGFLTDEIEGNRNRLWNEAKAEISLQFGQHGLDHANKSL